MGELWGVAGVVIGLINTALLMMVWKRASDEGKNRKLMRELDTLSRAMQSAERGLRDELARNRQELLASSGMQREELANALNRQQELVLARLSELTRMNESKLEAMRETVERKLTMLQNDNHAQLEAMRMTVDEKLNATLEQRLGESFKLVGERLELVHKGLGEMQNLAVGVGDLKKVLSNVKIRGTMGEIQLETLLAQTLAPEQYERNAAVRKGTNERVDFVVKLPDKTDDQRYVLLPIDSKFPLEDYQRLTEAQEAGDAAQAEEALKLLEGRLKAEAKSIRDKYLNPPQTTEFAIMFLPLEGLYAEVLRRPGLWDMLQREYRVIVTGPTTFSALLNSLQMGFRTLAIQKRTSEVWRVLGAVKTEFGKFGGLLEKTQKKLQEASNTLDGAAVRTRAIERKLRDVEELPAGSEDAEDTYKREVSSVR